MAVAHLTLGAVDDSPFDPCKFQNILLCSLFNGGWCMSRLLSIWMLPLPVVGLVPNMIQVVQEVLLVWVLIIGPTPLEWHLLWLTWVLLSFSSLQKILPKKALAWEWQGLGPGSHCGTIIVSSTSRRDRDNIDSDLRQRERVFDLPLKCRKRKNSGWWHVSNRGWWHVVAWNVCRIILVSPQRVWPRKA